MFSGMGDIAVIALEEVSVEKKIFHRRIFALKQCPEYSSTEMSNAEYSIPEIQIISEYEYLLSVSMGIDKAFRLDVA